MNVTVYSLAVQCAYNTTFVVVHCTISSTSVPLSSAAVNHPSNVYPSTDKSVNVIVGVSVVNSTGFVFVAHLVLLYVTVCVLAVQCAYNTTFVVVHCTISSTSVPLSSAAVNHPSNVYPSTDKSVNVIVGVSVVNSTGFVFVAHLVLLYEIVCPLAVHRAVIVAPSSGISVGIICSHQVNVYPSLVQFGAVTSDVSV